jgi:phosphoribosylaminoimidazolecarboxamide formyltransferase/IMP cyclohydrolase
MRALLSVHDKTGLVPLARALEALGVELVASGGTSRALEEAGVAHRTVEEVTGAPELLDGRVKTLHPALHAGILADRARPTHLAALAELGIDPIDIVVCNFYPFEARPEVETIDVGGPTMVRAAAKNHAAVTVVVDPADYDELVAELRASGTTSPATRRRLAAKAFARLSAYDAAVAAWLAAQPEPPDAADRADRSAPERRGERVGPTPADGEAASGLPERLVLELERAESLRYGENPHQRGARYRVAGRGGLFEQAVKHAGSPLSYLNLYDAFSAWRLAWELAELGGAAAVVVKHGSPCGAALAEGLLPAWQGALGGDPIAAFGGVAALTGVVDLEVAEAIAAGPQLDVVVAEAYEPVAIERLVARRRATRILSLPRFGPPPTGALELRSLGDDVLVQEPDRFEAPVSSWQVVTTRRPDGREWRDLQIAWRVVARALSNAVALVRDGQAVGVGAGQQSRVEAAAIAVRKAGPRAEGAVAASDAFFPFRDGLDVLADGGVIAVVQPGGSVRDAEVVAAAKARGLAMVLTGERHFRH